MFLRISVLVPDLFRGNPWRKGQDQSEFEQWFSSLSLERVANDIAMTTKWMADEFLAAGISKKLNLIGFCFGGRQLIEILARDKQAYFGTGACFYGTQMNPSLAAEINVPVLFISGDNDPFCPLSTVYEMEKRIEGSRVVIYNGRGHGFAHRPESPEEDEDAENAFVVMRHWLHDYLVVNKG
ncbi:hypothetical protein QJS10_CPB13g00714 [Acorus calamus]|uniref:Carboxymethylenebutenolidase homolog n=1 Tax=Acorus calamus TaxID=4465 RepID=A0AAV9DI53_ACOCL|nr:hypothetical protein QJS10_CPB13g00714 [Acorus calamus]